MFSKDCILRLACMCSNSGLPNWLVVAVVDKGRQKFPVSHMQSIVFICFCNTASSFAAFLSHHTTTKWIISVNALSKRAAVQIPFWQGSLWTFFWLFYSCSYTGWTCSYKNESRKLQLSALLKMKAWGWILPFCRLGQSALILLPCSDVSTEVRCQSYLPCKLI